MRPYLLGLAVGLALLVGAGATAWWVLDERALALAATPYDVPMASVAVPTDDASLVEGERLAWLHGCHGCHADSMQGKVFIEEPRVMRLVAPNITQAIQGYSDPELERLIRHGVKRNGTAAFAMPSAGFYHFSDADVGRLIAHLRAAPVRGDTWPPTELRILTKVALLRGDVPTDAGTMDHRAPRIGDSVDTSLVALGGYRATTVCTECHGITLRGQDNAPALVQALGYTLPQFTALLVDGRARDGRDIGLMGRTALRRFRRLTPREVEGLWHYLRAMPLTSPP
jgi:cytochrome c553